MAKKRRMFLVEKQVQGALGWRIASHWLIFLGLSVFVSCSMQMLGTFEFNSFWESFEKAMISQVGSIAVLLALLPWFVHDSLKLSNRFAGPMLRLRKSIVELTNQDSTPPVAFRSGDFWQEIAGDFNQLRIRILAERRLLVELDKQIRKSVTASGSAANTGPIIAATGSDASLPATTPV